MSLSSVVPFRALRRAKFFRVRGFISGMSPMGLSHHGSQRKETQPETEREGDGEMVVAEKVEKMKVRTEMW
jgi:hypothetical protein